MGLQILRLSHLSRVHLVHLHHILRACLSMVHKPHSILSKAGRKGTAVMGNTEAAPLTGLCWMRTITHIFTFWFSTVHASLASSHDMAFQLPKVILERCTTVQTLLEVHFWQSNLVTSQTGPYTWKTTTATTNVL